ncbi:unnamed protein product, partial [Mesorhabditis spiculigera]
MTGSLLSIRMLGSEQLIYDYDYDNGDCYSPGSPYLTRWMEMPEQRDPKINTYAMLIWILFGTIGFTLSTYAFLLIYRKKALSLGSKLFLLSSCYIRATQSLFCFFKAHCVMTMWCISLRRAPFSGFFFNNFISNYHQGVADTLRWLTAGLALNRDRHTGYICHGGIYFSPGQLALAILYVWNPVFWEIIDIQEIVISYLYWVTFVVDLMTFWKIRMMVSSRATLVDALRFWHGRISQKIQ